MKFLSLIPALMIAWTAHAQTERNTTQTNQTEATEPMALKDNQITKVLLTINEGEIKAAKMAERRATRAEVKEFAKMMSKAHRENMAETKKIAKENKLKIRDSQMALRLADEGKLSEKSLKDALKEKTFDKAYMTDQVAMHEKALSTIDTVLLPQVENANLKAHLEKTRASVAEHLDHAKALQTKL